MHIEKDTGVYVSRDNNSFNIHIYFTNSTGRNNIEIGIIDGNKIKYEESEIGSRVTPTLSLNEYEFRDLLKAIKLFEKEFDISEVTYKDIIKIKDEHLSDMRIITKKLMNIGE